MGCELEFVGQYGFLSLTIGKVLENQSSPLPPHPLFSIHTHTYACECTLWSTLTAVLGRVKFHMDYIFMYSIHE